MSEIVQDLFTVSGLIAFIFGVATVYGWNRIKAWYKKNGHSYGPRFRALWVGWAVVTIAIMFVGIRTQDTWECQSEFSAALKARSALSAQNEQLSAVERDALQEWITALLTPPDEVAALPPAHPQRRQYGIDVTTEYVSTVADARDRRAENERDRALHPLPEADCGR